MYSSKVTVYQQMQVNWVLLATSKKCKGNVSVENVDIAVSHFDAKKCAYLSDCSLQEDLVYEMWNQLGFRLSVYMWNVESVRIM